MKNSKIFTNPIYLLAFSGFAVLIFKIFGPFMVDPEIVWANINENIKQLVPGWPTIEPNILQTLFANGYRSAVQVFSGQMPLWNHYVGLGQPLLGEMQSAALFPFTWLYVFPNGLIISQALLQIIGSIGTYLFLRKYGLSKKASFFGGLLFQFNGVFAWLQNTCFNPIAFFPMILFSVESLYREFANYHDVTKNKFFELMLSKYFFVGLVSATLAVYSGFPEIVFLYSLFIISWVFLRFFLLKGVIKYYFITLIFLLAFVSLLLSMPILISFIDFLDFAHVGAHSGEGYSKTSFTNWAFFPYFFPYIFGMIFSNATPINYEIWGSIGGYVGFIPLCLSCLTFIFLRSSNVHWLLLFWIFFTFGASHGLPVVRELFYMIPLTKIVASYRYLNIIWIFCFIFLASIFIDSVLKEKIITKFSYSRKIKFIVFSIFALLFFSIMYFINQKIGPFISKTPARIYALFFIFTLIMLFLLIKNLNKVSILIIFFVGILESVITFIIPIMAYPYAGEKNYEIIDFLKDNIEYQRFVTYPGQTDVISVNLGSYYGISQLNYNDIPSPNDSYNYIKKNLDPYASFIFLPNFPFNINIVDRQNIFLSNLKNYGNAGVKYFLTENDVFDYTIPDSYNIGKEIQFHTENGDFDNSYIFSTDSAKDFDIEGISIWMANFNNSSDGELSIKACSNDECSKGYIDLMDTVDNSYNFINFDKDLKINSKDLILQITRVNSRTPLVLRTQQSFDNDHIKLPLIQLKIKKNLDPVFKNNKFSVYQIEEHKKYFEHPDCEGHYIDRDNLTLHCQNESFLNRLEMNSPGWSAFVNDSLTEIKEADEVFQSIRLQKGENVIQYKYSPRYFGYALILFFIGLIYFPVYFYNVLYVKRVKV